MAKGLPFSSLRCLTRLTALRIDSGSTGGQDDRVASVASAAIVPAPGSSAPDRCTITCTTSARVWSGSGAAPAAPGPDRLAICAARSRLAAERLKNGSWRLAKTSAGGNAAVAAGCGSDLKLKTLRLDSLRALCTAARRSCLHR